MSKTPSPVLTIDKWTPSQIKYMAPKVNDKGGKSINVISKQTNRTLHISTPLMLTWGISDYVDEKTGESDGKFNVSLQFPRDDERSDATDQFLTKLKEFENQILDDATANAEHWFGDDSLSREVIKHMFFPILKYSKNKDTKKIDMSRPPSIRAKVPNYDGKWGIEIYDTQANLIFPCENPNMTPMDFVPKLSNVACVLSVSQIWVGGKGFGLQLKLMQCVVKPKLIESVFGKCHIHLSTKEIQTLETQKLPEKTATADEEEEEEIPTQQQLSTVADSDSDDEKEDNLRHVAQEGRDVAAVHRTLQPVKVDEDAPKKKKVVRKKE